MSLSINFRPGVEFLSVILTPPDWRSIECWSNTCINLSIKKGKLVSVNTNFPTICDALTVKIAGKLTFKINKKLIKGGLVVTDNEVKKAIRFLKKNLNIIAEPGGAVPVAALLSKYSEFNDKVVVVMVSGGNIDQKLFNRIMSNG